MIKRLILILIFLSITSLSYAERYYVYIDKIGKVEKGQEAGQNEKGDVIGVYPYTSQYKPTKAELSRYKIMVVDLTAKERSFLVEEDLEKDVMGKPIGILRARKRRIDVNQLQSIKQEQEVDKKTLIKKIRIKSRFNPINQ